MWRRILLVALIVSVQFGSESRAATFEADTTKADTSKAKKKEAERALPLKPERKIEFTTNEGSWLSLDLSPDGQTLVFDLLADLMVLDKDPLAAIHNTTSLR